MTAPEKIAAELQDTLLDVTEGLNKGDQHAILQLIQKWVAARIEEIDVDDGLRFNGLPDPSYEGQLCDE